MLTATEEERADVVRYLLSQSPKRTKVTFLQKVYSEALIGHRHDVWDVHTNGGRWWVITNPTNLYSQEQFPNMDLVVTFHVGLCLRVPRTEQQRKSDSRVIPFGDVLAGLAEATDALGQAQKVADYQAVGMRAREVLLAFIRVAQDITEWATEPVPKRADFRAWTDLICNTALPGADQRERRHLFKSMLTDAWVFSNWLTHAHSATWHDAEAALAAVEHALGLAISLVVRQIRGVPELCPECGSPHLFPEEGWREDLPEVAWERPVCADCGWTGRGVPVPRNGETEGLFTRAGHDSGECAIMTVPLAAIRKPGEKVQPAKRARKSPAKNPRG
ncbi:gamma-glutamyl cyclotransferase [Mesorhizobium sp. LNHC252B00]|uniref:hypothetical protein n=1 Tax=Mesorhizobium sp. LNHC252B00 TaxID=1287252 RepID=UPI0003CF6D4B|nr:hypothetical protein [Mesorhizobium sp. LNHC252B00]ESY70647.1 gamma-glutamyl cyclotransferase [Mesorhizobium sp. LNHC252B00]